MESTAGSIAPAGLSVEDFARQAGISRATFYTIDEELRPSSVRIGRRLVITESPASWLERMTKRGGISTSRTKEAAPAAAT